MKASIDIGSNTVLLLVGEVQNGKVQVHHEAQRVPRLAKGVDENKNLDPDSMQRAVEALIEYKEFISRRFAGLNNVIVMATSAVRDANNRDEFIDRIYDQTGWSVQLLSGEEEARLMYQGALSVLENSHISAVVIDIGGGSTEVAVGKEGKLQDVFSYNMGSVRFTERFLKNDPPLEKEIEACRSAIKRTLESRVFEPGQSARLVGIAGTVTSLAAMVKGIQAYDSGRINNVLIGRAELSEIIEQFSTHPSQAMLKKFPNILEGRADVILGGLLILDEFMKFYDKSEVTVSTGGIRHGAILHK